MSEAYKSITKTHRAHLHLLYATFTSAGDASAATATNPYIALESITCDLSAFPNCTFFRVEVGPFILEIIPHFKGINLIVTITLLLVTNIFLFPLHSVGHHPTLETEQGHYTA